MTTPNIDQIIADIEAHLVLSSSEPNPTVDPSAWEVLLSAALGLKHGQDRAKARAARLAAMRVVNIGSCSMEYPTGSPR